MASENSPHIPAWKKLGLKLKYAKDEASLPSVANGINGTGYTQNEDLLSKEAPRKKRRFSDSDDASKGTSPRTNGSSKESRGSQKLKKKVSFSAETKTKDGDTARPANPPILLPHTNGDAKTDESPPSQSKEQRKARSKSKSTKQSQPSTSKPKAGLSYLAEFYSEHPSWKFSKNHSTWLLKNALSESAIPRSYNFSLACYLHNLQSTGARQRLRDQCEEARHAGNDWGKDTIDQKQRDEFTSAVKLFAANPEDFAEGPAVSWATEQKRTDVIWWTLNDSSPDTGKYSAGKRLDTVPQATERRESTSTPSTPDGKAPQRRRNKKSRTAITAADLSSSSSSSSESDDSKDDENDISSSSSDSSSNADSS